MVGRQRHRRHTYIQVQPAGNAVTPDLTATAPLAAAAGATAEEPAAARRRMIRLGQQAAEVAYADDAPRARAFEDDAYALAGGWPDQQDELVGVFADAQLDRRRQLLNGPSALPADLDHARDLGRRLADAHQHGRDWETERLERDFWELAGTYGPGGQQELARAWHEASTEVTERQAAERQRREEAARRRDEQDRLARAVANGAFTLPHRVVLDTTQCVGCLGRGERHYGRSGRGGTGRCDRCYGSGREHTTQARQAARHVRNLIRRTLGVPAGQVQPGDRLLLRAADQERYPAQVISVRPAPSDDGRQRLRFAANPAGIDHLDEPADAQMFRAPTPAQDAAMQATVARYRGCTVRDLDLGPAPADVAAGEGADG